MDQEKSDLHGLLKEIQCRDQVALEAFYDATVDRVFALVMNVTKNKVLTEEIISDVFMQVWRNASRFDSERASPLGWLLMMARSRAIDTLRYAVKGVLLVLSFLWWRVMIHRTTSSPIH